MFKLKSEFCVISYFMTIYKNISILIYEDTDFLRIGLQELLNNTPGLECKAAFSECTQILDDIKLVEPDVIIMDIDMPGMTGIEGVKIVQEHFPQIPVMMHTVFDDNKKVFDAICNGASGYLLKKATPSELIEGIFTLAKGGAPMTPTIAVKVLQMFRDTNFQKGISKEEYNLTEKEKTVLGYLVTGNSYKMIAAEMNVSVDGIKFHLKNIYKKLHVNSQTEAVSKAIQQKII